MSKGHVMMRRFFSAMVVMVMTLGLSALVVPPAQAAVTSPNDGSVVRGNVTFSESGGIDRAWHGLCGGRVNGLIELINASGSVVASQYRSGRGDASMTLLTQNYPNGNYTVRGTANNGQVRSWYNPACKTETDVTYRYVTIDNQAQLDWVTPPSSGPQGTSVQVSARLTDQALPGNVLAGRAITFSLSGGASVVGTTNGQGEAAVQLPLSGPPRNGATVTATFAATPYYGARSITRSINVLKNGSSVVLAPTAPVVSGQSTSFTATVTKVDGTSTPSGTVQFRVDGVDVGAPVVIAGGQATSPSISNLAPGTHSVVAVYSGDANFTPSTSDAVTQKVLKASTTVTLTGQPNPTVSGQAVTFRAVIAVVAPGQAAVSGAVQFNIDGQPYGTAVPVSNGAAELTVSSLATGNHTVVAVYNGNDNLAGSTSNDVTHGVNKADSNATVTSSVARPVAGQPVSYSAEVKAVGPGSGVPTGQVQFQVDGVDLGGPVTLVNGRADSAAVKLNRGTRNVTVNYLGDDNFSGTQVALTQEVFIAETVTTLETSPQPSVFGQPVQVTVSVSPQAPATGDPTGFVQIRVDNEAVGTVVQLRQGGATTTISSLAVGQHTVTATYLSSDPNFASSTSAPQTHQVTKAQTKTTLTSSAQPTAVFGQALTFTATVSPVAPGAGNPSGTIVFKDGDTVLGTQPVNASTGFKAAVTVSDLIVGQHAISATYSGDDSFNGSSGATTQTVLRAQTQTTVTSSANPAQSGEGVQFTATVAPVAPGAGAPTGTVTFFVNGAPLGGPAAIVNGVANSATFASLSPGSYRITATYAGDANFVTSNGALDQGNGLNVVKGATEMTVTTSPDPSAYGEPVTVRTTVKALAPASGKPTGVVQIWRGDELLGATGLDPQNTPLTSQAAFTSTDLAPGEHSLRAVYVGNYNFAAQSATVVHTVKPMPSVTGLVSSAHPAVAGQPVTFIATVTASVAGHAPSGTVTFTEGETVLGTAPVVTSGNQRVAELKVSGLSAGSHEVKATYSGDASVQASTSTALSQQVTRAETKLVAADVRNPLPLAPRAGFLRARLTDRQGAPLVGRTVSFFGSGFQLCDAITDAEGVAECNLLVIQVRLGLLGQPLLDVNGSYDVVFAGDDDAAPARARGYEF